MTFTNLNADGKATMSRKHKGIEPVAETSAEVNAERLAILQEIFPEIFTEGKVDPEKLRTALGEDIEMTAPRGILSPGRVGGTPFAFCRPRAGAPLSLTLRSQ